MSIYELSEFKPHYITIISALHTCSNKNLTSILSETSFLVLMALISAILNFFGISSNLSSQDHDYKEKLSESYCSCSDKPHSMEKSKGASIVVHYFPVNSSPSRL